MPQEPAPDNDRADIVLVTNAKGEQEEVPIPAELMKQRDDIMVSLSPETIEALGQSIARALGRRLR